MFSFFIFSIFLCNHILDITLLLGFGFCNYFVDFLLIFRWSQRHSFSVPNIRIYTKDQLVFDWAFIAGLRESCMWLRAIQPGLSHTKQSLWSYCFWCSSGDDVLNILFLDIIWSVVHELWVLHHRLIPSGLIRSMKAAYQTFNFRSESMPMDFLWL